MWGIIGHLKRYRKTKGGEEKQIQIYMKERRKVD
jgi:hypothetical protein